MQVQNFAVKIIILSLNLLFLSTLFKGHELPYSIQMNHTRNFLIDKSEESENLLELDPSFVGSGVEAKCHFALKKSKKGGHRLNLGK